MSVLDRLRSQINAGKITFDPTTAPTERLKKELLGENIGTKVSPLLQKLVLEISKLHSIRISSIIRNNGHHATGRAFDVGNEEIAEALLSVIATDAKVKDLQIDEIIFDASVANETDRNKWNYDRGRKHDFDNKTLEEHRNHIHFAVVQEDLPTFAGD
jgi:hypothetical protein